MALTDTAIRNAKAKDKPYKLGDAGGLFILVQPSGAKLWRLKYRIHGKEKKVALGRYPDVGLAEARKRRDDAKAELAGGKDPSREKQRRSAQAREDASNTFALVAAEYIEKRKTDGAKAWAGTTAAKNEWLYAQLAPTLGAIPIADIEPLEVLAAVRKIEARGNLESARRALQLASGIFRHAVATARLKSDPTRDLKGALRTPDTKNRAAILDPVKLGELLRAIDGYGGHYVTKFALELIPHVFLRPGELRQARWSEIDLEKAVWAIPASRTKMRKPHHVPLSRQVLELLRGLHALSARHDGYVFPSIRSHTRPMSENTLNAALRRLGFTSEEVSAHGFRSTASTLLNEALDPKTGKSLWSADAIEKALAHGGDDKVRNAYHRGTHWQERVAMAQWWSDHLDTLRKGADVVSFPNKEAG
ncbi:integrase [Novosphingobium endophyticum]|uniref:Integrase n=1 Tax=Novosphingobium endophyticum TaxID=1955250 RepID=A0A916X3T8_9SPHN|nr:integrase arm-type DNA-binding domain-containing protein [Novosphingobium endophyticum]GGB87786.1 integrase [Novosphingobium endophyticum]